jgi:hypothetical protein
LEEELAALSPFTAAQKFMILLYLYVSVLNKMGKIYRWFGKSAYIFGKSAKSKGKQ